MIDHTLINEEWQNIVIPNYDLPTNLRNHQKDSMTLLKQGRHVFLGTLFYIRNLF